MKHDLQFAAPAYDFSRFLPQRAARICWMLRIMSAHDIKLEVKSVIHMSAERDLLAPAHSFSK
jgi:hypothetical protein